MIHRFRCAPSDLFTYGVRLAIPDDKTKIPLPGGGSVYDLSMSYRFCTVLTELICHPIWCGDIARLRYAIQSAVVNRISSHSPPLGPVELPQGLLDMSDHSSASDMALWMWRHQGVGADPNLVMAIAATSTKKRMGNSSEERHLFMVDTEHLRTISKALESITLDGARIYHDTKVYLDNYRAARVKRNSHPPIGNELRRWKKTCLLAQKRDAVIRHRLQLAGMETDCVWLDCPRRDDSTCVRYFLMNDEVSDEDKKVLKGMVDCENRPKGYRLHEHDYRRGKSKKRLTPSLLRLRELVFRKPRTRLDPTTGIWALDKGKGVGFPALRGPPVEKGDQSTAAVSARPVLPEPPVSSQSITAPPNTVQSSAAVMTLSGVDSSRKNSGSDNSSLQKLSED
ncbi:hypothetical protein F4778DRAFT_109115 [Xylariomycetidae sp. FL2044]|nr:hypothetical protein F4778DRAFT_109115 [Xylariomycetidae sp. FL2044]